MELIHAAILLHESGKEVSENNIKRVIDSVGIHKSEAEIKALVVALEGVDIKEAVKQAAIPMVAPVHQETKETKATKEEKKEETKEAAAGLGSLFG